MAVILSNYTYTVKSEQGNPVVQGWLIIEFRAASYQPGGEFVDLTPNFKHAVGGPFSPISGALVDKLFQWNEPDLSGSVGLVSARIQIFRPAGSGAVVGELLSGTAISGIRTLAHVMGY